MNDAETIFSGRTFQVLVVESRKLWLPIFLKPEKQVNC